MKKKGSKIRQLNNKGMSLVEAIIAMAILAIVAVPVLSILVSTVRYNANARERHHMTLSAESIMESFKAYDIETLCRQFYTSTFMGCELHPGGVDAAGNPISPGTLEVIGKDASGLDTTYLFDASGKFIGSSDDTYQFRISNFVNENDRYDAVITVEPYTALGTSTVVTLGDMNPYKDAIWRSGTSHDIAAQNQVMDHFTSTAVPEILAWLNTEDKIKNDYIEADIDITKIKIVKRETFIDIVKGSNITAQVRMKYHYQLKDCPYYADAADPTNIAETDFPVDGSTYVVDVVMNSLEGDYVEFYNNPVEAGLERIFIYYYPAYVCYLPFYLDSIDEDVIEITTSGFDASELLECYVLKQVNPDVLIDYVEIKEASYTPEVIGTGNLMLYHNFDENISGSSSVSPVFPYGFYSSRSYTDASLIKEDKTLMYSVKVDLYEAGGTNIVSSLEGTMND